MDRFKLLEQRCRDLLDEVGFGTSRKRSGGFESWVSVGKKIFKQEKIRDTIEDIYNIIHRPATLETPDLVYHKDHPYIRIPESWDLKEGDVYLDESGQTDKTARTAGTAEDGKAASSAVAFYRPLREFKDLAAEKLILENYEDHQLLSDDIILKNKGDVKGYYYFKNEHFATFGEPVSFERKSEDEDGVFDVNEKEGVIKIAMVPDGEKYSSRLSGRKDKKENERSLEDAASEVYEKASNYTSMGKIQAVCVEDDEIIIKLLTDDNRTASVSVPY